MASVQINRPRATSVNRQKRATVGFKTNEDIERYLAAKVKVKEMDMKVEMALRANGLNLVTANHPVKRAGQVQPARGSGPGASKPKNVHGGNSVAIMDLAKKDREWRRKFIPPPRSTNYEEDSTSDDDDAEEDDEETYEKKYGPPFL